MTHSGTEAEGLTPCKERSVAAGFCRHGAAPDPLPAIPFETGTIWEESGFKPPWSLALGIELLHRLSMAEDTPEESLRSIAYEIMSRVGEMDTPEEEYIVADPAHMIRTAVAYGVPVAGRIPEEIARAIVREIVADYLPIGDARSTDDTRPETNRHHIRRFP